MTAPQIQGQNMAMGAATAYQPDLTAAQNVTGQALANGPANPNTMAAYMSPYIQDALAPQVTALNTQIGQQHQALAAGATGAGAFGDSRQGAYDALTDFYGNQSLNGLEAQGYNTAFNNALNTAIQEQGVGLQGAGTLGTLGGLNQSLGLTGANATYTAGQQQQAQQQQELTTAYQQFLNQVNWPYQMLNVRESALSNSPYNIATAVTLPQGNAAAQGFGGTTAALGTLASLLGGSGGGVNFAGGSPTTPAKLQ
jgi:hypothetical protein